MGRRHERQINDDEGQIKIIITLNCAMWYGPSLSVTYTQKKILKSDQANNTNNSVHVIVM